MKRLIALALFVIVLAGCTTKKNYVTNVIGPQDWQPPVLTWQSLPDAEVRGTVGLDVSVTDSSAIPMVRLFVDGALRDSLTARPYRFSLNTDSLADGVHLCEARAADQFGNLGISPVLRVNVMNTVILGPHVIWVPDGFATIQAAINAATDFDTIRVRDGTYYETLNLFGKGVWIESEHGALSTAVSARGLTNAFFVPSSSVPATIRGFSLTGAYNVVFMDDGAQLDLFNNMIVSSTGADSSYTLLFSGFCGGHFVNNLFLRSRTAIQLAGVLGTFENNILESAWNYALWNSALSGNPVFHGYNVFWQNGHDYAQTSPGEGEFNADPLIDLAGGRLLPDSPCVDRGDPSLRDVDGTRSDIGPFGGPKGYR